jgi:hypothetical protein
MLLPLRPVTVESPKTRKPRFTANGGGVKMGPMSKEDSSMASDDPKPPKKRINIMSPVLCMAVGAGLGAAFDQIAIGAGIGLALGLLWAGITHRES